MVKNTAKISMDPNLKIFKASAVKCLQKFNTKLT